MTVPPVHVDPGRILAFRIAAQHLGERIASPLEVARGWFLQDSPPGSAALALHARVARLDPGWLEAALADRSLVGLYNPRTATALIPSDEVELYLAGLRPVTPEELGELLAPALPQPGTDPGQAQTLAVEAVSAALDGRTLSRDELHAELRERLPEELLPWCAACESRHARRGLLVAAGLNGRLCLAGRAGRQPAFARTDQWVPGPDDGSDDLDRAAAGTVRRYLRRYAPSTSRQFAEWAGIAPAQAARSWALVEDELAEVSLDQRRTAWVLADDRERLLSPPEPRGVRLLPPGDPLLQARDRELLVPDPAARKRVWRAIGSPGVVLADGRVAGLWRGRKKGRKLEVEVEAMAPLTGAEREAIEAEAQAAAPHRGCREAVVELSG